MIQAQLLLASDVVLCALAAVPLVPSAVVLTEALASTLPRRPAPPDRDQSHPRTAVLIPAHNESSQIGPTVAAIVAQLSAGDRALVIADNCTDDTAAVARAAGADVYERHDPVNRGKGHALAAGLARLADAPPEVVLFFDADVVPPMGAVRELARQAVARARPLQAVYLLRSPDPSPGVRATVSELAFLMKNAVRPQGLHRLGLPVPLTGTGIALPWACVSDVSLATSDLVEDMKLGLDLLRAGHPPALCPDVVLVGDLPDNAKAAHTQRTRWEHGHLSTITRQVPKLLSLALTTRRPDLAFAALDLMVPPLALLSMLLVIANFATLAYAVATSRWAPLAVSGSAVAALALAVGLAWGTLGRHLSLLKIVGAPLYVLWKVPLYFRFLTGNSQTTWIRTERPTPPTPVPGVDA